MAKYVQHNKTDLYLYLVNGAKKLMFLYINEHNNHMGFS